MRTHKFLEQLRRSDILTREEMEFLGQDNYFIPHDEGHLKATSMTRLKLEFHEEKTLDRKMIREFINDLLGLAIFCMNRLNKEYDVDNSELENIPEEYYDKWLFWDGVWCECKTIKKILNGKYISKC